MRLALIGGISRSADSYRKLAGSMGHALEVHDGEVGGRGSVGLRSVIARADVVLVLTDVNSHGAVGIARREAREAGKPAVLLRRCGLARLRALLETL
ncbi:DUF2325 domain-containing protein [Sandaracinus amylolyticus]|uniref:DUF2325 domain-containing protein n=1 Tax=Sandaracinus amylolyticus TaxID=927083 RepID=UPI001F1AB434|nr:DUF2325 domain-containing protein [Sandaracinus amylolyticus]UJR81762.1 Hypothetical protein I5071_38220 [Sandaracinus amylolyticus]